MDGIRLNDFESLEACGANNQKIVEEITRAFKSYFLIFNNI
jgi:aarF domain-containing kinase